MVITQYPPCVFILSTSSKNSKRTLKKIKTNRPYNLKLERERPTNHGSSGAAKYVLKD